MSGGRADSFSQGSRRVAYDHIYLVVVLARSIVVAICDPRRTVTTREEQSIRAPVLLGQIQLSTFDRK